MALATPYSYRQYQGDGATRTYSVPFPYLKREDVRVFVDGTALVEGVGYSWTSNSQIQLTTATSKVVEVRRITPEDLQLVQWLDGSYIIQDDLNTSDLQWLYLLQEHRDGVQPLFDADHHVLEASETVKGIVRLATAAETTAGASKALAVHPSGLRVELEKIESVIALMEDQIRLKAPLASPALTGAPTAPTPSAGENSTRIATTAWAKALLGEKASLASPAFTGTPTAPTPLGDTNSTQLATTAFVQGLLTAKAPLASPTFSGTPQAPTPSPTSNSTQLATTAFVQTVVANGTSVPVASETVAGKVELATAAETTAGTDNTRAVHPAGLKVELNKKANLASPALTGTPTAPTAATSDSSTQVATTAFVKAAVAAGGGTGGGTGGTVIDATEADKGIVQLATAAEAVAGLNSTKAVHPAGLKAAVDGKASLASPAFTGAPTAPTAGQGTNSTQLATTAFVNARTPNATETVVGMVELATTAETQAGTLNSVAVHPAGLKAAVTQSLLGYAPLTSPALTGTPTAPTATEGTNTTQLATTAFVQAAMASGASVPEASETVAGKVELATAAETTTGTDNTRAVHPAGLKVELDKKAPLASPNFSGTPIAPTATAGTNTNQIATTAFVVGRTGQATDLVSGIVELANSSEVQAGTDATRAATPASLKPALDLKAPLVSPALTGTPTAPTATAGTNSTQIATTAFVTARTPTASETVAGLVELATTAETTAGTSYSLAVHPAGLKVELDKKANLASPVLTGTPTAPTALVGTDTNQVATTAFVHSALTNKSTITAPAAKTLTGTTNTDFIGIPSGVRRITILAANVSLSGGSIVGIQLGTAGGWQTSDYAGAPESVSNSGYAKQAFVFNHFAAAAAVSHFVSTLVHFDSNLWMISTVAARSDAQSSQCSAGSVQLVGALNSIRLTNLAGVAQTFDSGTAKILYEF